MNDSMLAKMSIEMVQDTNMTTELNRFAFALRGAVHNLHVPVQSVIVLRNRRPQLLGGELLGFRRTFCPLLRCGQSLRGCVELIACVVLQAT
jgi:hypothetical protein